jgi:hypothetical protein
MVGPTTPVGMGSTYLEYALCTWGMEKRYHRVICKKTKTKKTMATTGERDEETQRKIDTRKIEATHMPCRQGSRKWGGEG